MGKFVAKQLLQFDYNFKNRGDFLPFSGETDEGVLCGYRVQGSPCHTTLEQSVVCYTADRRIDNIISQMQSKIDGKDKELWEAQRETQKLRQQIRNAETLIGKIPFELREKLLNKSTMERK